MRAFLVVLSLGLISSWTSFGEVKNEVVGNLVLVERIYPALPKQAKDETPEKKEGPGFKSSGLQVTDNYAGISMTYSFEKDPDLEILGPVSSLQGRSGVEAQGASTGAQMILETKIDGADVECNAYFDLSTDGYTVSLRVTTGSGSKPPKDAVATKKFLEECFDKYAVEFEKNESLRKRRLIAIKLK